MAADPPTPPIDGGGEAGPALGGPCLEDRQCNDGVDCTFDSCNLKFQRCQAVPDDSRCQNGVFCDGVERCDVEMGCRPGPSPSCNDERTCTIDRCIEATRTCDHRDRDGDGDGSPDGHCVVGGDCNDNDPDVYPGHVEVCGNRKDDDCDGQVDVAPCQTPEHDTCLDPLVIDASGLYALDTTAATQSYSASCVPLAAGRRDVVAALVIAGGPRDVDVVAEAPGGALAVALAGECGSAATEIACGSSLSGPSGQPLARLRRHALAPGTYPLYVWADRDLEVVLHVTLSPPSDVPGNETCGTAAPITPGVPVVVPLPGAARDLSSRCSFGAGDLVYAFSTSSAQDISIYGTSLDGFGIPIVSLRRAACSKPEDEIACGLGTAATAFARSLPPGTYEVVVSASAPTDVQLQVDLAPPTTAPSDDRCETSPPLVPNHTFGVSLLGHTDDADVGCAPSGSVDAAYALELDRASDVLLTLRISQGDTGAVSLTPATCARSLICGSDGSSPVRATARGVSAGSYRALVESRTGSPVELTAYVRPSVAPTLVPFSDTCDTAIVIGESGGFFQGLTSNANADYSAGCDSAGNGPTGAPDQMLKLVLSQQKRVIFDMQGSSYATLLDVRKGNACPGAELPRGCSAGYAPLRSFLDMTLDPGSYWVQVDGYGGAQGTWFLDVRVIDP